LEKECCKIKKVVGKILKEEGGPDSFRKVSYNREKFNLRILNIMRRRKFTFHLHPLQRPKLDDPFAWHPNSFWALSI